MACYADLLYAQRIKFPNTALSRGRTYYNVKFHSVSDIYIYITPSLSSNTSKVICNVGVVSVYLVFTYKSQKGNPRMQFFALPYKGVFIH